MVDLKFDTAVNTAWMEALDMGSGRLYFIKLDNNELAGTIPDLSGLTALTGLELFSNKLNGTVPDTIARFPKLQKLEISNNYLEGRLPDMSRMTKLKMLYAGKNLLGYKMPVPKWLGKLKLLTGLDLWDNKFTSLPDLPFAQYVDWCDFSGNAFSCPVPPSLYRAMALR